MLFKSLDGHVPPRFGRDELQELSFEEGGPLTYATVRGWAGQDLGNGLPFAPDALTAADVPDQLFFFRQHNSLFRQLCCFFAKWGLFFAKWGLFFASLYVHKSPAVLLKLGHPMAPLRFVCAI